MALMLSYSSFCTFKHPFRQPTFLNTTIIYVYACVSVIMCADPGRPIHGSRTGDSNLIVDANLAFACDRGYAMRGNSQTTCLADGNWTNPVPTCEGELCTPIVTSICNSSYKWLLTIHQIWLMTSISDSIRAQGETPHQKVYVNSRLCLAFIWTRNLVP